MEITIKSIEREELVDILSGALYSNSALTCSYGKKCDVVLALEKEYEKIGQTYCYEEILADQLLNGQPIIFRDEYAEEGEQFEYPVNLEQFLNGCSKYANEYPKSWGTIVGGDGDMYDCWNLIQMIMFGEVVYG